MSGVVVYLLESGAFQEIPGIAQDYPFCLLPFWGRHCLIDFALAGFMPNAAFPIRIVLEDSRRGLALKLSARWERQAIPVVLLENGVADLMGSLEREKADRVILCSLSSIFTLDQPIQLSAALFSNENSVVKFSIQKIPVETYMAGRRRILDLLSSYVSRNRLSCGIKDFFESVLSGEIDLIEEIPGRLLFQNDISQYYTMNLWLASNADQYARIAACLPELEEQPREMRIMEHGTVMDSYISAGAEIDGYVKNSVIFPNVVVRRDARIVNSVITTNNRVGTEAMIMNSLILPFEAEDQRNPSTIGAHCVIGGRSVDIRNACFPGQIRDGLTVVGMNVLIPNGFRAEAGSFIGPSASISGLRRRKILKKGGCHLADGREAKTAKSLGRG